MATFLLVDIIVHAQGSCVMACRLGLPPSLCHNCERHVSSALLPPEREKAWNETLFRRFSLFARQSFIVESSLHASTASPKATNAILILSVNAGQRWLPKKALNDEHGHNKQKSRVGATQTGYFNEPKLVDGALYFCVTRIW